ncbi:MAG: AAA family ATPase, partial [Acholeplasma sp.]|nr:AAA family ATPase [Acholeplasma sp.]
MKLKSVKFNNYKSIKQELEIDLSAKLITLVGKNGSGKTNVLDAINNIFDMKNSNERKNMGYRFFLEFDEKDMHSFADVINPNNVCDQIEAYKTNDKHGLGVNIDMIKSPLLNEILSKTKHSIYQLAAELKKELEEFKILALQLAQVSPFGSGFATTVEFAEGSNKNANSYSWVFERYINNIDDTLRRLQEMLLKRKPNEEFVVSYELQFPTTLLFDIKNDFSIKYIKPKLTDFEQRHIIIDEQAIKKEIEKINKQNRKRILKINNLYENFVDRIDYFSALLDQQHYDITQKESSYDRIVGKIISQCNPKTYYLHNDNERLLFKDIKNSYRYRSLDEKTIIETFLTSRYSLLEQTEIFLRFQEKKLAPDEAEILCKGLEQFINDNLPPFEIEMIDRVSVDSDFNFYIIEKTGDKVPFSSTNSGRRWYFTYFFVKGCMLPGDYLFMDEPASNLHPEAQVCIRKDIEELSKINTIIFTTHSPYMISSMSN